MCVGGTVRVITMEGGIYRVFFGERGKLYMLQTRNGKRNGVAAVKMAVDMYREGLITQQVPLHSRVEVNGKPFPIEGVTER